MIAIQAVANLLSLEKASETNLKSLPSTWSFVNKFAQINNHWVDFALIITMVKSNINEDKALKNSIT